MTTNPLIRRRTALGALGMLTSVPMLSMPARAADPAKLKFTSFEPPVGNIYANVMLPFTRAAVAGSGGTLQIDMFPSGTLTRNPTQHLKLVTDGAADIAWHVMSYTPGRFDDCEVVGLPFVTRNATEASVALHRLFAQGMLGGFDGLHMLALAATPPVVIHGNQAVRTPADLKGKRVRVSGDHLTRVVEALGGAVVSAAGPRIPEVLSKGVVDMTLNNWGFVGDFKVNEVSSVHLDVQLGAVAVGVVMRRDRYESLPAPARAALDKVTGEVLARRIGQAFDRQETEVREKVSKSGRNKVSAPTVAERADWKRLIEPVNENWRKASPKNERLHAAFTEQVARVRAGA